MMMMMVVPNKTTAKTVGAGQSTLVRGRLIPSNSPKSTTSFGRVSQRCCASKRDEEGICSTGRFQRDQTWQQVCIAAGASLMVSAAVAGGAMAFPWNETVDMVASVGDQIEEIERAEIPGLQDALHKVKDGEKAAVVETKLQRVERETAQLAEELTDGDAPVARISMGTKGVLSELDAIRKDMRRAE
jgi:hypothetical protein